MKRNTLLRDVAESAPSRRKFMERLTMAGAAGAAIMGGARPALAAAITDTDILNFALNLEYLEAEFYTVATTGQTIDKFGVGISGMGMPGPTTGGSMVNLNNDLVFTKEVALEIASDERDHVNFLRSALGSAAVAKPAIVLNALGIGFSSQNSFLTLARAFEDVGVTAYAGAAPLLTNPSNVGYAARILATEAEHSANLRLQVARLRIPTTALDGVDILPPPSGSQFFPVDKNALVETRTTGQVLYIVYGMMANVTKGGFFPNGVNGNIVMSSTSA